MLSFLGEIIPIYVNYTTQEGHPAVRARTWHPAWFIPVFWIWLRYWLDAPKRYRAYQETLAAVTNILQYSPSGEDPATTLDYARKIVRELDCGYGCAFTEPYGFVPEAGCPVHD